MALAAADGQWRISLSDDQMSPHLVDAIVAVEDSRFFEHHGVDWRSVGAAAWHDVTHLSGRRGASTLTMQLEQLRDPQPHTLFSKIEQAVRAEQIESRSSKRQILAEYLESSAVWGKSGRRWGGELALLRPAVPGVEPRGGGAAGGIAAVSEPPAARSISATRQGAAGSCAGPHAGVRVHLVQATRRCGGGAGQCGVAATSSGSAGRRSAGCRRIAAHFG